MLFSCQVGHCDGAMIRGPPGAPARRVPCQPPRWDGQHHMAVGEIRLLRVLLSVGGKKKRKELSFCRKVGVKVLHFHFYSFDVKNSQRSAVRMGPDTPRTVQGTADPPVAFWHLCCRLNVLFGCPGSSVSDLQPSLSHYRSCHNAPFPLWSWFSPIYSATFTCILVGFYVFLQINT